MLEPPTFRSTGLPLILTLVTIVVFNAGLYAQLGSQPKVDKFSLPYREDFSDIMENPYEEFGGDWEIRDEKLIQLDTNGFDLTSFIPLTIEPNTSYTFRSTLQYFGGSMGGGLIFNAQQVTSRQKSHMIRFNVDNNQLWLIYGYFGDDSNFGGQGSAQLQLSPTDNQPQRLEVVVKTDTYDIKLNEQLIARDIPLVYLGGAVGFITSSSQVGFDDIEVVPIDIAEVVSEIVTIEPTSVPPTQTVIDNTEFLTQEIYSDTFDTNRGGQALWIPISGNWAYEDNALVQKQTELYDLSNIYQNPISYPMTYSTKFRHINGIGGGLLFNLESPNSTNNAYMLRYISDADVVAWGYFDDIGRFNGVGSAGVPSAGSFQHELGVTVSGNTFDVILDGKLLAANIPMHQVISPSYVGLTASQSMVAFDSVDIFADINRQPTANTTVANIDSSAAIGTWAVDGNVIIQTDTEATDYVAGTGLAGEQFTISVDIQLDNDFDDTGAGIIFHMASRDNPANGYLVRFANHGRTIFWGQYDGNGIFTGLGDATLNSTGLDTATLGVVVGQSTFDILVDEQVIGENIPLARNSGWIGLVSFRGSVTFSDLSLLLGGS